MITRQHGSQPAARASEGCDQERTVLAWLKSADGALFASEISARWEREGRLAAEIEPVLARLQDSGAVMIASHASPDRHLDDLDRRTVAACEGSPGEARLAADRLWNRWLRDFLAMHRCS